MPYDYATEKPKLFCDDGQRMFLAIRDHVAKVCKTSGAITVGNAMQGARSGDSWVMLACIDRLIELGELRRYETTGVGQDAVLVTTRG